MRRSDRPQAVFEERNLGRAAHIRTRTAAVLSLAAVLAVGLAATGTAQARVHGLMLGFSDDASFQSGNPTTRQIAFQHARAAGTEIIRLGFGWADLAPDAPPNIATTTNPDWSGYRWGPIDQAIRETVANGFIPLFIITGAPRWAEGPGRPAVSDSAPEGSWRPSAVAFRALAVALAKRYSGRFPDPANPGSFLPRVRYWQGWNEPNLTLYLSPQWTGSGRGHRPASPDTYRALLNGWYAGLKSVSRSNLVVTAGTTPFGDYGPPWMRMPPAYFWRELFCLRGRTKFRRFRCPSSPVHFDVLAHHPYPIGPPRRVAPNVDDVVVPDWPRITRPLAVAIKDRTVAPRTRKQLWATEISWDSNPPDPMGIPAQLEARYMEGAFQVMWSQGVTAVVWYLMRDQPPAPTYADSLQSGIYFRGPTIAQDTRKPSFTAFSFPFTAYKGRGGRVQFWGLAPRPGPVTIQRRLRSGAWVTFARLRARSDRLFLGTSRRAVASGTNMRAVQGRRVSLSWKSFYPGH